MMILVVGGSGSGKSSYAEDLVLSIAQDSLKNMKKYYLATMQVFDQEGQEKVKRHRNLRNGKGFLTIEQPTRIAAALEKMEEGRRIVLLECISNLTANEMFSRDTVKSGIQVTESILQGIKILKERTDHLVVVSNNVFEDGITYEETTMEYILAMGKINRKLAALADKVVEVAAGIPVIM